MAAASISRKSGYSAWMLLRVLCVLAAPTFSAQAENPKVLRESAPTWVKPQPVDLSLPATNDQVGDGVWDLLVDEQANVREKTRYQHYAQHILTQNGVQNGSRVSISFDPGYESLVLNKLVVYRDGKASNRLPAQEVKLLQRESGLAQHLYDGRFSAVMLLEDIRPGDIIEYAFTIRGANPIFDGLYLDSFSTRWSTPLHRLYQRVLWPAGRKLAIKSYLEDFPPTVTQSGRNMEYVWEKTDTVPLISDGDLPPWFDAYSWVQLSEFQSWKEVSDWAMKVFTMPAKAPANLQAQADLLAPITDPKAKAVAALRFVQKNIRYLGIEVGAHSHKPYPVEMVLQRRFGDCKDKALLLTTLLRQLGFEAYPALVNVDEHKGIAPWLPSPLDFNHLVVQLRLEGRTYWLDPTRSNQGAGLDELYFPDYGEALVVKEGTDSLTKITPGGFDAISSEITESFTFADFKGQAKLNVRTVTRGNNANHLRSSLADTSHSEIEKSYLNFYAKQYPDIKVAASPKFTDDFEKNEIVGEESYIISHFWQPQSTKKSRLSGEFYARSIRNYLDEPDTPLRTMPFAVVYPERMTQTIRVSFPPGLTLTDQSVDIKDPAFQFQYKRTFENNLLTLRYTYESLQDHVDVARVPEYIKNIGKLRDELDYQISFNQSFADGTAQPTPEEKPTPAAESSFSTTDDWLVVSPFICVGLIWGVHFVRKRRRLSTGRSGPPVYHPSLHRCAFCGKTEHSAPEMEFRVSGSGDEYCLLHLPRKS